MKYIKLIVIFFISLIVASSLINNVFLGYTPKIRENWPTYIVNKIKSQFNNLIASRKNQEEEKPNEIAIETLKQSLKPITKGVSAAQNGNISYTKYDLNEVEWTIVTYTLKDGKKISVRYPKGMPVPPQNIFEE